MDELDDKLKEFYEEIKKMIDDTREKTYQMIDREMLDLYWNIYNKLDEYQKSQSKEDV